MTTATKTFATEVHGNVIEVFDAVKQLNTWSKCMQVKKSLPCPELVLVGGQSAGKSKLLDNIIGQQFNDSRAGTIGTRFPIVFSLYHDPKLDEARFSLNSISATVAQVRNAIKERNDQLNEKNDVSDERFHITVKGPDCVNLQITDLPGLRYDTENPELAERIRRLVLKEARNPHATILVVAQAGDDTQIPALRDVNSVDPEKKRTVVIRNKLDAFLPQMRKMDPESLKKFLLKEKFFSTSLATVAHGDSKIAALADRDSLAEARAKAAEFDTAEVAEMLAEMGLHDERGLLTARVGFAALRDELERRSLNDLERALPVVLQQIDQVIFDEAKRATELQDRAPAASTAAIMAQVGTIVHASFKASFEGVDAPFSSQRTLRQELTSFIRAHPDLMHLPPKIMRELEFSGIKSTPDDIVEAKLRLVSIASRGGERFYMDSSASECEAGERVASGSEQSTDSSSGVRDGRSVSSVRMRETALCGGAAVMRALTEHTAYCRLFDPADALTKEGTALFHEVASQITGDCQVCRVL